MPETVSIIVKGKVQGVFFRQSTKETAIQQNIQGEVSNQPDGSVHIIATGEEKQLKALIDWCYQGPKKAVVTDVSVEKIPLKNFASFRIVR